MFFSLEEVPNHPVYQLQDAIGSFFLHCSTQPEYQLSCFPNWFEKVINRSPVLRQDFQDVADLIYSLESEEDRHLIYTVFQSVNNIENLCNNKTLIPETLKPAMSVLEGRLKELFKTLYDKVLNRKLFDGAIGSQILDHYKKFKDLNKVCPFCGIEDYNDRNSLPRNCYDHYLSESKYFFAGVNFKNIVPMCEKCNDAGNKGSQDVLFSAANRREVFYPYEKVNGVAMELVCLRFPSIDDQMGRWQIDIKPELPGDGEKVETWKKVFKITSRLEARIQEKNKDWMDIFIRRRFQNVACDESHLKTSLQQEAEKLLKNIKNEREAIIESTFMLFIATKAKPEQLSGYCGVANSDYTEQMSKVGAALLA